jgi:hypothetical protein
MFLRNGKREREADREREVVAEAGFTPLGYLLLRVNATSRYFLLLLISGVELSYNLPYTGLAFFLATALVSSTSSKFCTSWPLSGQYGCPHSLSTLLSQKLKYCV